MLTRIVYVRRQGWRDGVKASLADDAQKMREVQVAAAEVAVSRYQLSDERTRPLYIGGKGQARGRDEMVQVRGYCRGRRLAGVYRR